MLLFIADPGHLTQHTCRQLHACLANNLSHPRERVSGSVSKLAVATLPGAHRVFYGKKLWGTTSRVTGEHSDREGEGGGSGESWLELGGLGGGGESW
jgi:hypothetical protein